MNAFLPTAAARARPSRALRGFTLIEVMIALAVIAILSAIAYPQYTQQVVRASREAAQAELLELAAIQEKIYINSSGYASSISGAYNGTSAGGLGVTSGKSRDGRYTFSLTAAGQNYTLTATPVGGTTQAADGELTLAGSGQRLWRGTKTW